MVTVSAASGKGSEKQGAPKEQVKVELPKEAQRKLRAIVADGFNGHTAPKTVKFNNQRTLRNVPTAFEARLDHVAKGSVCLTIVSECGNYQSCELLGNRHGEPMKDIDLCNLVKNYLGGTLELKRKQQSTTHDFDRGNN